MSKENKNVNTENIRLLPAELKNEQFNLNCEAFKQFYPELFKRISHHQPKKYQICLNPDDSINVYDRQSNTVIYPTSQSAIDQLSEASVDNIQFTIRPNNIHNKNDTLSKLMTLRRPLNAELQKQLINSSIFKDISDTEHRTKINKQDINFIPLLRVYGIGLGDPLRIALQKYDVAILIVHENSFDLFYSSLYSTPWNVILDVFKTDSNRSLYLNIAPLNTVPNIDDEKQFLEQHHPFFANCKAELSQFTDPNYLKYIELETLSDFNRCIIFSAGCYEDQFNGFKNSLKNVLKNNKFYNNKSMSNDLPIFLIGSGPSLDSSIDYLKQHHKEVIIISSGSSISVLIKHNIIPDIHLLQERYDNSELLLKYADRDTYKKIICIKLNVVSTEADSLYKAVYTFQKANDPGSTLLPPEQYPHSHNTTPTVTNLGVFLCSILNPKEVFLFGLDYGSSASFSSRHSKDALVLIKDHEDGEIVEYQDAVADNLTLTTDSVDSEKVFTDETFLYSKQVSEIVIEKSKHIQWVNVGSGAKIVGTHFIPSNNLPSKLTVRQNKTVFFKQLDLLFDNHFSTEEVFSKIRNVDVPASQSYLLSMLELFDTVPQTRLAMMSTFTLISNACMVGDQEDSYLPKKLFSLEFMGFINNLFVIISTTKSDEEAVAIYQQSVELFVNHIHLVYEDFIRNISDLLPD